MYTKHGRPYFYNNTFYRVGQTGNNAIIYSIDSEGDGSDGQFINNILIPNGTNLSFGLATANTLHNNNYWGTASYGPRTISETGMVNGGNPFFLSAHADCLTTPCDFHISASSVVKDKGMTVAGFSEDTSGVGRPQGSAWDIGAYEFVSGGAVPPAAPRGLRAR